MSVFAAMVFTICATRAPSGTTTRLCMQVGGVDQHVERLAGLHLLLQLVVADLDVAGLVVLAGRLGEGVDALDHARLLQLPPDLGRGGAALDLVEHRPAAGPGVVGRGREPRLDLVVGKAPAEPGGAQDDHEQEQHRQAAAAARTRRRAPGGGARRAARRRSPKNPSSSACSSGPGPVWLTRASPHSSVPRAEPAHRRERPCAVPARGLPAGSPRRRPGRPPRGASGPCGPGPAAAPRRSRCSGARRTT